MLLSRPQPVALLLARPGFCSCRSVNVEGKVASFSELISTSQAIFSKVTMKKLYSYVILLKEFARKLLKNL